MGTCITYDIKTSKNLYQAGGISPDLNQSSFNLINIDFINSCEKNFILINTSRGKCVNKVEPTQIGKNMH